MHPNLASIAQQQHGPFTRAQALGAGYTPAEVRSRLARGSWVSVRRGVMVEAEAVQSIGGDARSLHLLRAAAALLVISDEPVLSDHTAARSWRLPLVGRVPEEAALTQDWPHQRRSHDLELHVARTPSHHRDVVDGFPVTSAARTVSDLARSMPFGPAVAAADDALRRGLCTWDGLAQVIADCPTWRGIARTKRVLEFADGRSESPGESLSRVAIAAARLPAPVLQQELAVAGRQVRVDFFWPEIGVVGEFDGALKYDSGDPAVLVEEKWREDGIRRLGYRVVRWGWRHVYPSPAVAVGWIGAALRSSA